MRMTFNPAAWRNRGGKSKNSCKNIVKVWREARDRHVERYGGFDGNISVSEDREMRRIQEFTEELLSVKCKKGEWLLLDASAQSPYDGCFYEPNFWFLSPDFMIFFPLYVSHHQWYGRTFSDQPVSGARNLSLQAAKGELWFRDFLEDYILGMSNAWEDWQVHIVKADATLYPQPVHPNFALNIWERFNYRFNGSEDYVTPGFTCHCCGQVTHGQPFTHQGDYHGVGGVASATERLYCEECMSHTCSTCGVPVLDVNEVLLSEEDAKAFKVEEGPYCESCIPEAKCWRCTGDTKIPSLRKGFCPDCVDEVLQVILDGGTLEALCPVCSRPKGESQVPHECQDCFNKEMGRNPV